MSGSRFANAASELVGLLHAGGDVCGPLHLCPKWQLQSVPVVPVQVIVLFLELLLPLLELFLYLEL